MKIKNSKGYGYAIDTSPSGAGGLTYVTGISDFNSVETGIYIGLMDISQVANGPTGLNDWALVVIFEGGAVKQQIIFAHNSNRIFYRSGLGYNGSTSYQPWTKVSLSELGGVLKKLFRTPVISMEVAPC